MNTYQKLCCAICVGLVSSMPAVAQTGALEGEISINATHVTIAGREYKWSSQTECRDDRQVKLTCRTLAAVGYADRARVVIAGDKVIRIDILILQQ